MVSDRIKVELLLFKLSVLELKAIPFWLDFDELRVFIYLERSIIFITLVSLVEWPDTNANLYVVIPNKLN